jgi:hypothetical protein
MNRIYQITIWNALLLLLSACSKDIPLTPGLDQFNVKASSLTYNLGDTVKFSFEGNPDLISFYSGELYKQYEFKEGRDIELKDAVFSFSTAYPTITGVAQPNQFSVHASTDFNGDYTSYNHIQAATWTDITNKFTYATSGTYVPSKTFAISDLKVPGKPLYIGFKYVTKPIAVNGPARSWYVNNIAMIGNSIYGPHLLGDLISSDFKLVEQKPEIAASLSTYTATRITLSGYKYADPTDPDPGTETWAISKGFNMEKIDNGPDAPFVIKGNEDSKITTFNYMYETPGVYKVHFIGANINIDGAQRKIIELTITIK